MAAFGQIAERRQIVLHERTKLRRHVRRARLPAVFALRVSEEKRPCRDGDVATPQADDFTPPQTCSDAQSRFRTNRNTSSAASRVRKDVFGRPAFGASTKRAGFTIPVPLVSQRSAENKPRHVLLIPPRSIPRARIPITQSSRTPI